MIVPTLARAATMNIELRKVTDITPYAMNRAPHTKVIELHPPGELGY